MVYCAAHPAHKFTTIVGWYNHATVYRYYQECEFKSLDGNGVYIQSYNAIARKEDNLISWNGATPKYDIRDWAPEHDKMGKGITLIKDEMEILKKII